MESSKKSFEILLCYRGRFNAYVTDVIAELRRLDCRVTYDREILSTPRLLEATAEIDWQTFGSSGDPVVSWRAPLRAAIDASELVVFAYEDGDLSENVFNEMRWAIQSGAHTFVLIHGAGTELEAQAMAVAKLGTLHMYTTRGPEHPAIGHHFCDDVDEGGRKADCVVAANRVVAHLARCRSGDLPTLSGENTRQLADGESSPLVRARRYLQEQQAIAHARVGSSTPPPEVPVQAAVAKYLHSREATVAGESQTHRQLDEFRRAEDILRRIRPTGLESTEHLSGLIVHAAAVESIIHDDVRARHAALDFHPSVILGTIPASRMDEGWNVHSGEDFSVLLIDGSFLNLLLHFALQTAVMGVPGLSMVESPASAGPRLQDGYVHPAHRYLVALGYALIGCSGAWPLPAVDVNLAREGKNSAQVRNVLDIVALEYAVRSLGAMDDRDPFDALAGCFFTLSAIHLRRNSFASAKSQAAIHARESREALLERLTVIQSYFYTRMIKRNVQEARARQGVERAWAVGTSPLRF